MENPDVYEGRRERGEILRSLRITACLPIKRTVASQRGKSLRKYGGVEFVDCNLKTGCRTEERLEGGGLKQELLLN